MSGTRSEDERPTHGDGPFLGDWSDRADSRPRIAALWWSRGSCANRPGEPFAALVLARGRPTILPAASIRRLFAQHLPSRR